MKKSLVFAVSVILLLMLAYVWVSAAMASEVNRIILQKVELKNSAGEWIDVAEPDTPVSADSKEAGTSFFNNGRIPDGSYINFRLIVQEGRGEAEKGKEFPSGSSSLPKAIYEITGSEDFSPPISILRKTFISVWFSLVAEAGKDLPADIQEVELNIDQSTTIFGRDKIVIRAMDKTAKEI